MVVSALGLAATGAIELAIAMFMGSTSQVVHHLMDGVEPEDLAAAQATALTARVERAVPTTRGVLWIAARCRGDSVGSTGMVERGA